MTIKLHPHQVTAIQKMHNGCVLWGGVGTGKTITALAYSQMREADKQIVVVTTAKKRDTGDWEREASLLRVNPKKIQITSWNKIKEFEQAEDTFFIFDEQRLVGTGAWVKSFYKIAKRNHWILLSATPGDTWSDYAPMFIANGWYKNITQFRSEHAIYSKYAKFPKIEKWMGVPKLRNLRDQLLVEMPMIRHTTPHMHYVECEYDHDKLDIVRKKRWNVYEDKPLKNAAELFGVMRKVVSSDPSRSSQLVELISQHPKLIVFYNYNYELEMMRALLTDLSSKSIEQWNPEYSETPSGLILPKSHVESNSNLQEPFSTETDSPLPPWELTPEEIASGQKVTTRHISREDTIKPWNPTEQTKQLKDSPSPSTNSTGSTQARTPADTTLWIPQSVVNSTDQVELSTTRAKTKSRPSEPQQGSSPNRLLSTSQTTGPSLSSKSWDIHEAKPSQLHTENTPSSTQEMNAKQSSESNSSIFNGNGSFGWAEWNGHKHQPIPDTDRWVYLVQYASGSEGWNCVETDAMAFWSLTYSWKQFSQAQGRIDRLNTPFEDLHYYAFVSKSPADTPVLRALEAKHDFQPSSIKM